MAVEGARGPTPSSDRSDYDFERRDSRPYGSPSQHSQEPSNSSRRRSRASSRAASETANTVQPQPIYDAANAVNYAIDRSDAASHVDPKLIAVITEQVRQQVIESLKTAGIGVPNVPAQQTSQPDKDAAHAHAKLNGRTTNAAAFPPPPRDVYTPPSPNRVDYSSSGSITPEHSPRHSTFNQATPIPDLGSSKKDKRNSTASSQAASQELPKQERPVTAQRMPTDVEFTTLEKIWQPLFDADGRPTARLGCFLRGLALHLVNDYEPKNSLVITPAKMLRFYSETKAQDETFPWQDVFKLPCTAISKMYRDLRCQHHLVQDQLDKPPSIPSLTPYGFQTWMEAMIQAYPETEFQRLQRAVVNMPISNADDPKERFPKELTRRLLPKVENLQARQRCAAALACEGRIPLPKSTTFPPPPPKQPQSQPQTQQPPNPTVLERERSPYGGAASVDSLNSAMSDDDTPISRPIERERKPYVAKEGAGKVYEDEARRTAAPQSQPLHRPAYDTRPDRSKSTASTAPAPYPPPEDTIRRAQTSTSTTGRGRSPPFSSTNGYGTRSDGSVGEIPPHHYASNMPPYDTDDRRKSWRPADEDTARSNYPPGPRSVYADEEDYRRRSRGMSQSSSSYTGNGAPYSQPPPTRY